MMPRKSIRFPHKVNHRNASVTVYRIRRKDMKSGYIYSVSWIDPDQKRIQKQITHLKDALDFARKKAEILSSGKQEAANVHPSDLEQLVAAKKILKDVPLLSAIKEWESASKLTDGNLLPAARVWKEQHNSSVKKMKVSEAIQLFLKAKRQDGRVTKTSYEQTLPAFKKSFGRFQISRVSTIMLQDWLNRNYSHPVTRNTHRKRIVTLFRYLRSLGYLPRNQHTEAELTSRAKIPPFETGITDSATYVNLLNLMRSNHPHYLAAAVLAGFCGMRRKEIHNQMWSDISLERKFVRVSAAKPNTPAKRLVELCDSAIEWLLLCENRTGEVCPSNTMVMDRIRFIGKKAGLNLPKNCFRDSYISCRVAATGEIDRTALLAGTSAKMIHQHYRELVTPEEGEGWFNVRPQREVGEVVEFAKA